MYNEIHIQKKELNLSCPFQLVFSLIFSDSKAFNLRSARESILLSSSAGGEWDWGEEEEERETGDTREAAGGTRAEGRELKRLE